MTKVVIGDGVTRIENYAFYGCSSLASVVIGLLQDAKQTLAVAESCTGGGLGAALTAVPGSSSAFQGGVIAYSNAVKQALLGVPLDLLKHHGAVSDPVVASMAEGARDRLGQSQTPSIQLPSVLSARRFALLAEQRRSLSSRCLLK